VLESISQIDGQIVVKIFGDDSNLLKTKIVELPTFSSRRFKESDELSSIVAGRIPQLQIEVDRERGARYGLNVGRHPGHD